VNVDDLPDRVAARIEIRSTGYGTECWLWNSVRKDGYTQVSYQGKKWLTHRLTYTLLVGPIADGLEIDHLCRTQHCVNPDHLEAVTGLINTRRSLGNVSKTHCPRGHEYTPENTLNHDSRQHRECKACKYERNAQWRLRHPGYVPPSRRKSS
jgi:hypothetical protein